MTMTQCPYKKKIIDYWFWLFKMLCRYVWETWQTLSREREY